MFKLLGALSSALSNVVTAFSGTLVFVAGSTTNVSKAMYLQTASVVTDIENETGLNANEQIAKDIAAMHDLNSILDKTVPKATTTNSESQ